MKNVMEMTKKELQSLEYKEPIDCFNSIIIVPMNYQHDSGFQCMKYVLIKHNDGKFLEKVVGVVGGGSDVIHINGIGGYGKNFGRPRKGYDWSIDCLPKSKCLRLFTSEDLVCDPFVGSDFIFYVKEKRNGKYV